MKVVWIFAIYIYKVAIYIDPKLWTNKVINQKALMSEKK